MPSDDNDVDPFDGIEWVEMRPGEPAHEAPMSDDDKIFWIVYRDLCTRWRAGDLILSTFGSEELEMSSDMREHFQGKALLVAADLIVRGLKGEAAIEWMREHGWNSLKDYEARAALALVNGRWTSA
jgi:hypothetical protein